MRYKIGRSERVSNGWRGTEYRIQREHASGRWFTIGYGFAVSPGLAMARAIREVRWKRSHGYIV